MYFVQFPGLKLKLNISNVAVNLGKIKIYFYGIIICAAIILTLLYMIKKSKMVNLKKDDVLNVVLISLILAIVGARLYYVAFSGEPFYRDDPWKILKITEGGLAVYGGLILGSLAAFLLCKKYKMDFLSLMDLSSFGFLLGQGIGRWGNFTNQEAFGVEATNIFRMISENTGGIPVHPCFLYESFFCLLGFIILHFYCSKRVRNFKGEYISFYLVYYGTLRFFIESLRSDALFLYNTGIRVSQLVSIIFILVGVTCLSFNYYKIFLKRNSKDIKVEE